MVKCHGIFKLFVHIAKLSLWGIQRPFLHPHQRECPLTRQKEEAVCLFSWVFLGLTARLNTFKCLLTTSSSAFMLRLLPAFGHAVPGHLPRMLFPLCVLDPQSWGTGACVRAQWLGGKVSKCKCLYTDPLLSRHLGVLNSCGPSGQFMTVLWDCVQI